MAVSTKTPSLLPGLLYVECVVDTSLLMRLPFVLLLSQAEERAAVRTYVRTYVRYVHT